MPYPRNASKTRRNYSTPPPIQTKTTLFWHPGRKMWCLKTAPPSGGPSAAKRLYQQLVYDCGAEVAETSFIYMIPESGIDQARRYVNNVYGYRRWTEMPRVEMPPPVATPIPKDAWTEFATLVGLDPTTKVDLATAKRAWISAIKANHSDLGGDDSRGAEINVAWTTVRAQLSPTQG